MPKDELTEEDHVLRRPIDLSLEFTVKMPSRQPQLGTLALQSPSSSMQTVTVTPATCHDLSVFKTILKEYRRLDDTITMRLNRANALARDSDRTQDVGGNVQDQACLNMWREIVANWSRRTQLITYCDAVMDQSMAEKRKKLEEMGLQPQSDMRDPPEARRLKNEIFSEEVKRNQVHNELTVESIVRKRAVEAFRSRCQFFQPPTSQTDAQSREIWSKAAAGQAR